MFNDKLNPYMGDIENLASIGKDDGDKEYVQPVLSNLGVVTIPILRKVVSSASFRNEEQEVTDVSLNGRRHVRAVPNKFKFGERKRGLQILRNFDAGGKMAQNRIEFGKNDKASDGFDLNTIVFGDSANKEKYVLPVTAAAKYTDAISVQPYAKITDESFHIRLSEDGSNWDSGGNKNTDNLFNRYYVTPGACLFQTITFIGKTAPMEALQHLLISIGLSGAYGGCTSVYGINVENHIVGIYAGKFEESVSSPYVAIEKAELSGDENFETMLQRFSDLFSDIYPVSVSGADAMNEIQSLRTKIENDDPTLKQSYQDTAIKVGEFFDGWFGV